MPTTPGNLSGRSDVDARDYGMSMNATPESNVQSADDSTIVGEHALSNQQAAVFDTLDPRPDIPWSQSNRGSLSHPTVRSVAAAIALRDLASAGVRARGR